MNSHPRWSKLIAALKNAHKVLGDWQSVLHLCFPLQMGGSFNRCYHPSVPSIDPSNYPNSYPKIGNNSTSFANTSHIGPESKADTSIQYCVSRQSNEMSDIYFNHTSCWTHATHKLEVLKSLEDAFISEISQFQECAATFVGYKEGSIKTFLFPSK